MCKYWRNPNWSENQINYRKAEELLQPFGRVCGGWSSFGVWTPELEEKNYVRINSWSHLVFNANCITSVEIKTKNPPPPQRLWIVINHRNQNIQGKQKKFAVKNRDVGRACSLLWWARVLSIRTTRFPLKRTNWPLLTGSQPLCHPQHAHTHSLLEAFWIPVQLRNSP
jgi:hypothetical protein